MEEAKSRTARGYSRSAPVYDGLVGHLYLTGLQQLLPHLRIQRVPAILDVGSGTGINLLAAAQWFAPTRLLCGIDLSPGMVEVARTKATALGVPAHFIVGDAERLPFPSGIFDLVICNSVLHWFRDRSAAVREMNRVLKPGGQLALICAAAPGFREWFSLAEGLLKLVYPTAKASTPIFPTQAEVSALLRASGFRIDHLRTFREVQNVTNPDLFVRHMSTVAPQWAADLPPEGQAQLERLASNLIRTGWPNGFPNTWSALEAIGTKTAV